MQARERYRGASTAGFKTTSTDNNDAASQRAQETFETLLKEEKQPVHAIAHIDLDGFYAAVERRRLNRPVDHPIAVQQWGSLIAVDYNCRPFGVKRGMSIEDAIKLCPKLECVHVGLIGSQPDPSKNNKSNAKVSLARYRRASFQVIDIFLKFAQKHGAVVQRTSIDESYLDFTPCVEKYLSDKRLDEINLEELLGTTHVVGTLDSMCSTDIGLAVASYYVNLLRAQVEKELTFTVSAGIAQNKLLAKIASSRNKPNKQTIIPLRMTPQVLRPLALRGVPGLGGKFGHHVEKKILQHWGIRVTPTSKIPSRELNQTSTEGESTKGGSNEQEPDASKVITNGLIAHVQDVDENTLIKLFGKDQAHGLYRKCHGVYIDKVEASWKPKSCLAMKSFWPPLTNMQQFNIWLRLLTTELVERIKDDKELCKRLPKTMVVHLRGASNKDTKFTHSEYANTNHQVKRVDSTIRQPMPKNCECVDDIMKSVHLLVSKLPKGNALPLTRLGLSAENFQQLTNPKQQLTNFFTKATTETGTSGFNRKDFELIRPKKKQKTTATLMFKKSSLMTAAVTPATSSTSSTSSSSSSSLSIPPVVQLAVVAETFLCDKCNNRISIVDALEHADFHVAVALATKDSKEHGASQRMKARSTATSNKSTKKKASNGLMAMFAKNAADKRKRKN